MLEVSYLHMWRNNSYSKELVAEKEINLEHSIWTKKEIPLTYTKKNIIKKKFA